MHYGKQLRITIGITQKTKFFNKINIKTLSRKHKSDVKLQVTIT